MSILVRTDHLPPRDRLEFWREEVVPRSWGPMECLVEDPDSFWAEVRRSDLGAVQVNLVTSTPQSVRRTSRMIRRSAPDLLKLVMALRGRGHAAVVQHERQAQLAPGDFALYDTGQPFEVRSVGASGPIQALTLHFPRALLPLGERQVKQLTAVPMRAEVGVGTLTSTLLRQLAEGIDHYRPAEAARLSAAALDVLATRLAHELDDGAAVPPEARRRALLTRIHAFIQEHLGDPELSPRAVAAAHHISLRYLYTLFGEEGETVAGWIRARRLDACRRALTDPAQATRPVAAIAARWGFSSAAYFSHVFKTVYGMPPQTYRQWARAAAAGIRTATVRGT